MFSIHHISPKSIFTAWMFSIFLGAALPGQSGMAPRIGRYGDQMRIQLESGRPLAAAAEALEVQYGWQINYEDPPSYCPQEITNVTAQAKSIAGNAARVPVLKPVRFEPTFIQPVDPPTASERRAIVSRVVEAARKYIGRNYTFMEMGGSFDLIPSGFLDGNCKFVMRSSVMDTRITLPAGPRTFDRALQEFTAALSKAAGRPVGLGSAPLNLLGQTQLPLAPMGGPARSVLRRLIETSKRKLAWQLLVEPGNGMALLNLHQVQR
ncbi:hypothetical protein [Paludibaculum fermentans]|uniref:Uncharacterized protein n=1 Tax=Paludibaculum fermentans TaxID=1473598 RepID=A0A7S7NTA4_PALFE|nr:hypothetical protein [Paludibaculum fermentans]QOY89431.1 hypothetical protein IRI77_05610 [Paludibaculum fermentans]